MYKITITKIDRKTVTKRGDYTIIDKRSWTDDELNKEARNSYQTVEQFLEKNPLKEIRDYAPSWQGLEETEVEVLKQTVEELNLAAVIKAVNGL